MFYAKWYLIAFLFYDQNTSLNIPQPLTKLAKECCKIQAGSMITLNNIKRRVKSYLFKVKEMDPQKGYDLWSKTYDLASENLMLDLDEDIFASLTTGFIFKNKVVADIGCGTGRHWKKIYTQKPAQLSGHDISEGMLTILKQKFPKADVHLMRKGQILSVSDESCDVIICTLAIAHISDIEQSVTEWNRILKTGGHIFITDYHPDALAKGGDRTFHYDGKTINLKNYIHPIEKIKSLFNQQNIEVKLFLEKKIDPSVKHYFEKNKALEVYQKFEGTPIIYGMHLIKRRAAA
ncbi:MAG TPA: class I SAM-dependent methyltransferase [Bacteroidia bacterium]|nr:class I SAM-dependent methyltransferase [Bacteroidia bacterium]